MITPLIYIAGACLVSVYFWWLFERRQQRDEVTQEDMDLYCDRPQWAKDMEEK